MAASREADLRHMRHAARLGLRGHGSAEPNPLVGCVIVSPRGEVVGWGYHRRFGGPHAELEALVRAGPRAAGATVYVTLEPCNHHGKTAPCSAALIQARVARVVMARRDPNPAAAGGMGTLRAASIDAALFEGCREAIELSDPFAHRLRTGLPWVIAKWAQTIDGCMSTGPLEDRWISVERSRILVHRERGRVDAILTGVGTVLADDPLLTARCRARRRIAMRVVVDSCLRVPTRSQLVSTARSTPTLVACLGSMSSRQPDTIEVLRARGVEIIGLEPDDGDELSLEELLRRLVSQYGVSIVLTECGPNLLSRLFQQHLVNEAWVFTAPRLGGQAPLSADLTEGRSFRLIDVRRRENDVVARYRVDG